MSPVAEVEPDDQTGVLAHLAQMSDTASSRFRRAASAYLIANASWRLMNRIRKEVRGQLTYRVTVQSDDDIYTDVHRWLIDQVPRQKIRAFTARTRASWQVDAPTAVGEIGPKRSTVLTLGYDSTAEQTVRIDGYRVVVALERMGQSAGGTLDDTLTALLSRATRSDSIVFTAYSADGRDAVVRFLERLTDERSARETAPAFFLGDRWGNWERRDDLPRRELDAIVLRDGQKEELVADLSEFLSREKDYARMGVPYHRGYLFEGPAGTGKTSIAQALATHFNLDLYYLPLSDMSADASLLRLVAQVKPRSVLLLEDIDVAHAATERSDSSPNTSTLSGLLNALDGVATPHGLIVFMTTNHLESLDEALVRTGRIDRIEHVDRLDVDQLNRLIQVMLGPVGAFPEIVDGVSPAQVVEVVKRHLGDQEAALAGIKELVTP